MPKYGVVLPKDSEEIDYLSNWTWKQFNCFPMKMDGVIGIIDTETSTLVGSATFCNFNGYNVELGYFGPETPTLGIARGLARIAIQRFNVIRVTIKTATYNDHIIRPMKKFGFEYEGIEQNFYGYGKDCVRLVLHRPGIERIAGIKPVLH